jgi:Mg2+-importing ATPase
MKKKNKVLSSFDDKRCQEASRKDNDQLLKDFNVSLDKGLNQDAVDESREKYGKNNFGDQNRKGFWSRLASSFASPFTIVLFVLGVVSILTDVVFSETKNPASAIIIFVLVIFSSLFRFITESRSSNAVAKLSSLVALSTSLTREGETKERPFEEVVVGDIVHLSNGDLLPADCRLLTSKDFFVSQSSLTGESDSIEKMSTPYSGDKVEVTDLPNIAFMGSTVISGRATAIVIATGTSTVMGSIASKLRGKKAKSAFNKGVDKVSLLLVKFMLVLVPTVFLINGFTKGDWLNSFLFAISVAVGITPEMLPMIVTTCLARGAIKMSKEKVIVKNIDSIQDFGAVDVLCTDKTGTLTEDKVVLEDHFNLKGERDFMVLRHAFLNSYFQTGLKNLMDKSIISRTEELSSEYPALKEISSNYVKVDEIPFDFERKRMSVVVMDKTGKRQLISKGAVEEIISICAYANIDGVAVPLTKDITDSVLSSVHSLAKKGYRTIAVAMKNQIREEGLFSIEDEAQMVLIGYLTFYDPPKADAKEALDALFQKGVNVKVLTGDNPDVTLAIAHKVGIVAKNVVLGSEIETYSDEKLSKVVEKETLFAKLSPLDKSRVVGALRKNGHVVGYMGDGINDAPALKEADIGISVDSAADIAKESADVILLEKSLMVLQKGIIEGRKTYGNMIKYIKMTASSNFGNIFSEIVAAAALPFLPMLPIHILILNLVSDLVCMALPWDNVDPDFIEKPRKWEAKDIGLFMGVFGPVSSIFDIVTYAVMFFIICPRIAGAYGSEGYSQTIFISSFQTGWFVESMWTQVSVIMALRSKYFSFKKNPPSIFLICSSLLGIGIITSLPYMGISSNLGLSPLGYEFYLFLLCVLIAYLSLAYLTKFIYMKTRKGNLY